MKIVCNDASEMIIQSADIQADGSLLIKTISTTASELKKKFRDPLVTRKIVVKWRCINHDRRRSISSIGGRTGQRHF